MKFRSISPLDGPDILLGNSGIAAEVPITIGELMRGTVAKIPNGIALRYKTGDVWTDVTYQEYYELCISAAKSFIKVEVDTQIFDMVGIHIYIQLGLTPSHAVVIIGFNACEWHISCLGAIFAG